ncbi:L-lysine 2,3-aminomutase [Chlamydiales bacterium SCGC AG-110-M15]|nr:L-lysine 2,3-aminomutase [Chlamydiales bacterium SCGC AG-110-M15]
MTFCTEETNTATASPTATSLWRRIQRKTINNWDVLAEFLDLSPEQSMQIASKQTFPLHLPVRLANKIEKGTLDDPILKQFLPTSDEETVTADFLIDPVGDKNSQKESKLLHKYHGRALLVCTSACAMHCRYCFRQHFDYETSSSFDLELEQIASDDTISEVLLSGGDPLSLSDRVLKGLLENLSAIPHVKRIRFHTRFPIGIPERLDDAFLDMLSKIPSQFYFVIHANHPREIDEDVAYYLKRLVNAGIPVMNQSVLLKDVNDNLETLKALSEVLINHSIIPYYLHQLDRVQGAAHFEVSEERGHELIAQMLECLPGYAVPRYVREIAGMKSKTPLISR